MNAFYLFVRENDFQFRHRWYAVNIMYITLQTYFMYVYMKIMY